MNEEEKRALITLLPNDLSTYQGTIYSGENAELVLVSEITNEQAETISEIELELENANEKDIMPLE